MKPKKTMAGKFLRELRGLLEIKQCELAQELGLKYPYISRYELGRSMPTAETLMKVVRLVRQKGICPFCDREDS